MLYFKVVGDEYQVCAYDYLSLNLISAVGPAAPGKSTFLNLLAGCKILELLNTYSVMDTFTKRVCILTKFMVSQSTTNVFASFNIFKWW